jgi:hypothetical protein
VVRGLLLTKRPSRSINFDRFTQQEINGPLADHSGKDEQENQPDQKIADPQDASHDAQMSEEAIRDE